MCIIILDVFSLKVTAPNLLSVVGVHGRTGTKFQAEKSHTHPGHSIHPTHSETWTTLLAYLYDHQKSLVGAMENNKRFSLNCTFTSLFPFLIFSNISVTPFFLVPVTSSPAGLLLLTELCQLHLVAKQPPHCNLFAHNVVISLKMT